MVKVRLLFIGTMSSPLARERFALVRQQVRPEVALFLDPWSREPPKGPEYLVIFRSFPRLLKPFLIFAYACWLLYRHRINVVHYHSANHLIFAYLPFVKKIVTPQGSEINEAYFGMNGFFTRELLRRAKFVTVKSPFMRQLVKRTGVVSDDAIVDLNWGVDSHVFRPIEQALCGETITILSYRGTQKIYNIDRIFAAVARLKQEGHKIYFVYVRFHPEPEVDLDLAICDEIIEEIDHAKIGLLLRRCDIVVSIPSYDGFATSIMETLTVGPFLVISDLPSYMGCLDDPDIATKIDLKETDGLYSGLAAAVTNIDIVRSSVSRRQSYAEKHYSRRLQMDILSKIYLQVD